MNPEQLWRDECELAFAWQHRRDRRARDKLAERFKPLVEAVAAERFRSAQLDKGFEIANPALAKAQERMLNDPELRGHFKELVQAGWVGLLEAIDLFDGRNRFATYARHWIFKHMSEYVRFNWNVVLMPEPAEWKVAKEDQIPPTIPNEDLNPFDNPYSVDRKTKRSRHITFSTPREVDDGSRAPEEWVVGRLSAGSTDTYEGYSGSDHFEPGEYQFRAHENMEALERAVEWESLSATCDARTAHLTPRKFRIIRARFPWAVDVKNCPDREDDDGFPRKHKREAIGKALGVSAEWVRRIEEDALAEMRCCKVVAPMTAGELLAFSATGNPRRQFHLEARKANWKPWETPELMDRLIACITKVMRGQRKAMKGSTRNDG
jgi:RNA polymerase sigma factor (sigma-70 family)